jgi:hypothetical protein
VKPFLPKLGELHGGKGSDREPAIDLFGAHFHTPAEKVAAEIARRRLGWPDADDAARFAVAEGAEIQRPGCVERAPGLDPIAAEMRPFEIAAGDAIADREIRAAAADGEAGQEIGGELIIEPARKASVVEREARTSCIGLPVEFRAAIEAGQPGAPARLVDRRLLR